MRRYIDADEFTKHIKIGSPVIFDSATINEIIFVLDTEPRVDAEPVIRAHWMMTCDTLKKCSNCGYDYMPSSSWRYCPHCGAKMDGGDKQMSKSAAERQVIVTWYKPEEKLPPDETRVVVTFSGITKDTIYSHVIGVAWCCSEYECVEPAWQIDGLSIDDTVKMHVEAWADLKPYGME